MIKTRFEIDTTRESLKNFTGSKEEEKKKCEEVNRKFGEAFGYYDSVAQWYDVLTQKAGQYIQMLMLQAQAQALVNKAERLNDYIDQAGKLQEITDALYENLTTTTKDNVFSDFLNSLYGLADGSEKVFDEIADNWQEMVNRMAVNNLVGAKFQKNLEAWYENLAKLNEARTNGEITDEEYRKRLDALKEEYDNYVKDAKNDIEQLRNEGIIKDTGKDVGTTQTGRSGAFMTMSQDQATKLEGLFVSGQMHWASIDDRVEDIAVRMSDAQGHLKKIEDNTGSSAQSLKDIKEEMKKITRDGVKVK